MAEGYSKPKVTIDLDEYNELVSISKKVADNKGENEIQKMRVGDIMCISSSGSNSPFGMPAFTTKMELYERVVDDEGMLNLYFSTPYGKIMLTKKIY
jgi:hypothetical protein